MADRFEILEVSRRRLDGRDQSATTGAWPRECHPDVNPDDPAPKPGSKGLAAAEYEVLSDPDKRSRYDQFRLRRRIDVGDPFGPGCRPGDLFIDAVFRRGGKPFGGARRTRRSPTGAGPRGGRHDPKFNDAVIRHARPTTVRTAACGTAEDQCAEDRLLARDLHRVRTAPARRMVRQACCVRS